jgi:hypothetical protein
MTVTSPLISFGLFALTVKLDATMSIDDKQTFSRMTDLKNGNVARRPYASYEPDFWLLDGGYKFKPVNDAQVFGGLISKSMSDGNGYFEVDPVLNVDFTTEHTTDGITLRFSQYTTDFISDLTIEYFDADDVSIRSDNYQPDSWEFFTGQAVSGFQKIIITFHQTSKPFRYLRMSRIDFGQLTYFTKADIKSAAVVEQISPLSLSMPSNTFDITLFSQDGDFSIINPAGDYALLKNKQPFDVYELVDNEQIYIGQFYLDRWENPSDKEIRFEASDIINVLENLPYKGGIYLDPVNVEVFLRDFFGDVGIPYELDLALYGKQIKGWIPFTTYREALQQIAFAIGATVSCARSGILRIYDTDISPSEYEYAITKADKGIAQSLTLKPQVTGVEVTAHNYIEGTELKELFDNTLSAGTHTITFNAPVFGLSVGAASIIESGANYAIIEMSFSGRVIVSGYEYIDTKQVFSIYNEELESGVQPNIIQIADATLVNSENVTGITQDVYDYFQRRYLQRVKLYASPIETSGSAVVDTLYNRQIGGVVERMEINLSGGFTSKVDIVGDVVP